MLLGTSSSEKTYGTYETYFLSPHILRTHILIKTGTQISCNRTISPIFFLNDGYRMTWMTSTLEHSLSLTIMKPMTKSTWYCTNPGSLSASSIYSDMDFEKSHNVPS